jgi:phosphotransferase system  glucose/maltose/N-acetylglucosamine-specific IIC component
MGIASYVSVCLQLYCMLVFTVFYYMFCSQNRQTTKKEHADKHTRKKTTKITKENSTGTKHKWKAANQKSREAKSLNI